MGGKKGKRGVIEGEGKGGEGKGGREGKGRGEERKNEEEEELSREFIGLGVSHYVGTERSVSQNISIYIYIQLHMAQIGTTYSL